MPRTITIAEQTVEELGGRQSILARQRRDHVAMDRLMDEYRALGDGKDRERVLKEIVLHRTVGAEMDQGTPPHPDGVGRRVDLGGRGDAPLSRPFLPAP
ncbi:hypothetical protein [Streptomyces sp. NPDC050287]|uniref:hypothetical protein n=1 Tax=Streptomyces sp. NPDC050287 TaxID=3365608 RepID=UPI0037AC931C